MSLELTESLLQPKIDSIARCLLRIEAQNPFALDKLCTDFDLQDILSTNVTRIVQLCIDICAMILSRSASPIPGDAADCFVAISRLGWIDTELALKMKKSVGMRNVMIREYEKIDWNVVYLVTQNHLSDIKKFVQIIVNKVTNSARVEPS